MKKKYNSRKWHNWVGIAVSIPTIIVGVTAVLIALQDTYKDSKYEPQINTAYLPGYSSALIKNEVKKKTREIRASFTTKDSITFIGTSYGLLSIKNDSINLYDELYGVEINCFAETTTGLLIGTKKGLFILNDNSIDLLFKKKIHSIEIVNDSTYSVSDNKKLYRSTDSGSKWILHDVLRNLQLPTVNLNQSSVSQTIPLHKLIIDLHTGKAFFGKTFEVIWIFIVGLGFSVLGFTGIFMWYDKKRKKRKRLKKNNI